MATLAILLTISGLVNFGAIIYMVLPKHDENNYVLLSSNLTNH